MELRTLNQKIKACGRIFPKGTIVRIMRTDNICGHIVHGVCTMDKEVFAVSQDMINDWRLSLGVVNRYKLLDTFLHEPTVKNDMWYLSEDVEYWGVLIRKGTVVEVLEVYPNSYYEPTAHVKTMNGQSLILPITTLKF